MAYLSDIEIAQACKMKHITEIAQTAHVDEKYIEQYGRYKAKVDWALYSALKAEPPAADTLRLCLWRI